MENKFSPKYIIIALVIAVLVLAGMLTWQYQQKPVSPTEETSLPTEGGQVVFKPWAETAEKYYPGGGNAIDFRDGAQGNFQIEANKSGDTMSLSWEKGIKVVQVKVYDIGTLRDLQDHEIIFDIMNWDINNPPEITEDTPIPTVPGSLPQPEVYLSSSYKIGDTPKGFFKNNMVSERENIFEAEKRYSIELVGVNSEGKMLEGYYTFTYEK